MLQTLSEDAADARHDTPYVPPRRCKIRVYTAVLACNHMSSSTHVHQCTRMFATHVDTSMCVCGCGFKWTADMQVLSDNG